jgi:mannose-1-phosphate guanylyltransferase/phosphomannomutase
MNTSHRIGSFFDDYIAQINTALQNVDRCSLDQVLDELTRAWREGRHVFLMGNGGSAAMASHMTNDLNKLTIIPDQRRLKAVSLADNVPLITAWANDAGYEHVFAEQLRGLCQPDDVVIAFSCSGNSYNVLSALRLASEIGAATVGITGDNGGQMADMVDICVRSPIDAIYQQEDIHLVLSHMLSMALRERIAAISKRSAAPPKALILAAGEGTRLRPHTLHRPKPMLPITGRPILEHIIDWLKRYGISEIAINLSYLPEAVMEHFGDGADYGIELVYSLEDPMMGTAGAVRKLSGFVAESPLVVVYGDVLTDLNLAELIAYHHENVIRDPKTAITMSLYHVPNPTEVGLVDVDSRGRIHRFVEKPAPEDVFTDLASAGILVMEPWVVDSIPDATFYDLGLHLFPDLLNAGKSIYGWKVADNAYVLDIGTPSKYEQALRDWPLRMRRAIAHGVES